eukprot:TRINITY_DN11867_c0_g1_i1.p1 TRINITY_DN11867_c0_g1~~TRINITY_DN11867_c0_g1_i1.p1  ORF type:complete len:519 (-),score=68.62 TRINITY_DN11867_c0_g1_i1:122-1612(-)
MAAPPDRFEFVLKQQHLEMSSLLESQKRAAEQLAISHGQALLELSRWARADIGLRQEAQLSADDLARPFISDGSSEDGTEGTDCDETINSDFDLAETEEQIQANNCLQRLLLPVLQSNSFFVLMTALVLANTILVGIIIDIDMAYALGTTTRLTERSGLVEFLHMCSDALLIAFAVEVTLRLLGEQCQFFVGPNKSWNIFESIVLIGCVFDKLSVSLNVQWLRGLRILRLFRVIRLIRSFKMFRELRMMLFSLVACLKALTWAFLLLLLSFYIFALYLQLTALTYLEGLDKGAHKVAETNGTKDALKANWSGVLRSIISLIYSCTGGSDWSDLAQPFLDIGQVSGALFILFVVFITLGVLNVLVALFVDATNDIHRWDREIVVLDAMERQRSKEDQLKHIFGHFASNRSYITVDQLRQAARDRYCKALFAHLDIDLSTGLEAFVVEADETQKLSKREFMNACRRLQARSQPGMLVSVLREQKEMHQKVEALRQAKA